MRFYLKLSLILGLFTVIQGLVQAHHEPIRETIFGLRCGAALRSGDPAKLDQVMYESRLHCGSTLHPPPDPPPSHHR